MTAGGCFVFLGPSLPVKQARALLDARYLSPVAAGDLYTLVRDEAPAVVAIIDGYFRQRPALWHKEVLYALSRGVAVYGAASMGALRAAELHPHGMIGVGRIFEAYRRGEWEDDDEVAVVHGPADVGYRPLSEAMANIRHGLGLARRAGALSPESEARLRQRAKATFYPERAWGRLLAEAPALGVPEAEVARLRGFLRDAQPNLKRDDARALLRRLAARGDEGEAAARPDRPIFEATTIWTQLTRARAGEASPASAEPTAGDEALWDEVLLSPQREALIEAALAVYEMSNGACTWEHARWDEPALARASTERE